jgi:hypothetical protein
MKSPISNQRRLSLQTIALVGLSLTLVGCVLEPLPPPGPPIAYAPSPCCAVYPEYPGYYGVYGGPAIIYGRGYYGGGRYGR